MDELHLPGNLAVPCGSKNCEFRIFLASVTRPTLKYLRSETRLTRGRSHGQCKIFPQLNEDQPMKKVRTSLAVSMRDFGKRAAHVLAELQESLLPDHASDVIGINVDTGEYVLASDSEQAWQAFRKRWPGTLGYVTRVDGGPVVKFYGR